MCKYFVMHEGIGSADDTVGAEYDFLGRRVKETFKFFLGDLMDSAILRSDHVDAMKKLTEKIGEVVKELERARQANAPLLRMVDGAGLRLSQRTVAALHSKPVVYDPAEFDWEGYQVILDISQADALKLGRIFSNRIGGGDGRSAYEKLPAELRAKFENAFKVNFD
jgi:hypothetical protein